MSVADCALRPDEAIRDTWRVRDLGFNAVILGTRACRECNAFALLPPSLQNLVWVATGDGYLHLMTLKENLKNNHEIYWI